MYIGSVHTCTYRRSHTCTQDAAGRIVGICNRTHVHMDRVHARRLCITQASIYLQISDPSTCARTQCMPQTGDRYEGDDL
jgi:hypothetical protein